MPPVLSVPVGPLGDPFSPVSEEDAVESHEEGVLGAMPLCPTPDFSIIE